MAKSPTPLDLPQNIRKIAILNWSRRCAMVSIETEAA